MSKIKWESFDPGEEYEYEHDWANRLLVNGAEVGDTILQAVDAPPGKEPTFESDDLLLENFQIIPVDGTAKLEYWLRGGTVGQKVAITIAIWTTQGRRYEEGVILPIKER